MERDVVDLERLLGKSVEPITDRYCDFKKLKTREYSQYTFIEYSGMTAHLFESTINPNSTRMSIMTTALTTGCLLLIVGLDGG